jgi:hypothetical protein
MTREGRPARRFNNQLAQERGSRSRRDKRDTIEAIAITKINNNQKHNISIIND